MCRTAKHGSTTWAKNFIHIYLGFVAVGKLFVYQLIEGKQSFGKDRRFTSGGLRRSSKNPTRGTLNTDIDL